MPLCYSSSPVVSTSTILYVLYLILSPCHYRYTWYLLCSHVLHPYYILYVPSSVPMSPMVYLFRLLFVPAHRLLQFRRNKARVVLGFLFVFVLFFFLQFFGLFLVQVLLCVLFCVSVSVMLVLFPSPSKTKQPFFLLACSWFDVCFFVLRFWFHVSHFILFYLVRFVVELCQIGSLAGGPSQEIVSAFGKLREGYQASLDRDSQLEEVTPPKHYIFTSFSLPMYHFRRSFLVPPSLSPS